MGDMPPMQGGRGVMRFYLTHAEEPSSGQQPLTRCFKNVLNEEIDARAAAYPPLTGQERRSEFAIPTVTAQFASVARTSRSQFAT